MAAKEPEDMGRGSAAVNIVVVLYVFVGEDGKEGERQNARGKPDKKWQSRHLNCYKSLERITTILLCECVGHKGFNKSMAFRRTRQTHKHQGVDRLFPTTNELRSVLFVGLRLGECTTQNEICDVSRLLTSRESPGKCDAQMSIDEGLSISISHVKFYSTSINKV